MADVIVLCAGASSRFTNTRPKWLLTHPNGRPMFARATDGLAYGSADVYVVCVKDHLEKYKVTESDIQRHIPGARLIVFDQPTRSQAESAILAVEKIQPQGAFFFKDCDSYFKHEVQDENCIVTSEIGPAPIHDLQSKCFVQSNSVGSIHNIVEKRVVSGEFAVGGYGFRSCKVFKKCTEGLEFTKGELFLSHLVFNGLGQGEFFKSAKTTAYEDYGTPQALRAEQARYGALFVDLDGTLLESAGELTERRWGSSGALAENIQKIQSLHATGRYQIIITTARPESIRAETVAELERHCIPFQQLIMGLLNAPRHLINDRGPNSPQMASATEVPRDTDCLNFRLSDLK